MTPLRSLSNRIGPALALALILTLSTSILSLAHPLGNFTINRYSRLRVATDALSLFYVVDMAEIPAYKAITAADTDGNGTLDEGEQARFVASESASLMENLMVSMDNRPLDLALETTELSLLDGQGGLQTLRLELTMTALLPANGEGKLQYNDDNNLGDLGWREVVVQAGDGTQLLESSVPATDLSDALRSYPETLLQNPPSVTSATITFQPAAISPENLATTVQPATSVARSTATDPFADLISIPLDGPWAVLLALLAAFVWGSAHALSPGHGKTIVAAYLVGSRGTAKHAVFLGVTTTITHTAGVFVLGGITLLASRYFMPEDLFPWLSVFSGLLVVGIGLSLCWNRLKPLFVRQARHHFHDHSHHHSQDSHHDHSHDHDHSHEHPHEHPHEHSHGGHTHSHLPPGTDGAPITWRNLLALGISGGILPCPSALVVMLGSIALGRVAFGLLLIFIFSLGLASVLTLIGILMVHAGKLIKYVPEGGRLLRLAPIGSALFITVAGIGITLQALWQIGSLSL